MGDAIATVTVKLSQEYDWRRRTIGDVVVHYRGEAAPVEAVVAALAARGWNGARETLRGGTGYWLLDAAAMP